MASRGSFDRQVKKRRIGRLELTVSSNFMDIYYKNPLEEEGLLCSILARLPLLQIFQLRGVCKLWNSVLCSPAFMKAWLTTSRRRRRRRRCYNNSSTNNNLQDEEEEESWFVMVRKPPGSRRHSEREFIVFDSTLGTWISLGGLLTSRCSEAAIAAVGGPSFPLVVNPMPLGFLFRSFGDFMAVRSDGGLFCFLCSPPEPDPQHYCKLDPAYAYFRGKCSKTGLLRRKCQAYYLLVLNPLTGSHTILPPPVKHRLQFNSWSAPELGISLQALADHQYRVFLWQHARGAADGCYLGDLEMYDSRTESWKAARSCGRRRHAKIGGAKEFQAADFLWFAKSTTVAFAYNAELDDWSRVGGKLPCQFSSLIENNVALIRHRGRVLAATVRYHRPWVLAGLAIWELDVGQWIQVARTPRNLWEGFYELDRRLLHHTVQANIICSGNLICMTVVHSWNKADDVNFYDANFYVPLVYDLDRDLWYHLPAYKGRYDAVAVCGMQPSLLAVA